MTKHFAIPAFFVVVAIGLFTCKETTTHPSAQPLPADPYERWNSYNLHNYTFDQIRACFCIDGGEKMRVTVRSDTVVKVVRLSDGSEVQYPRFAFYFTIDSLFGLIRHSMGDSLVIFYNSQYGYPEQLDINPQSHPVDGGVLYETSNLQVP